MCKSELDEVPTQLRRWYHTRSEQSKKRSLVIQGALQSSCGDPDFLFVSFPRVPDTFRCKIEKSHPDPDRTGVHASHAQLVQFVTCVGIDVHGLLLSRCFHHVLSCPYFDTTLSNLAFEKTVTVAHSFMGFISSRPKNSTMKDASSHAFFVTPEGPSDMLNLNEQIARTLLILISQPYKWAWRWPSSSQAQITIFS